MNISTEKELYELYLKDKDQYYFKKITHPFTEYNNMVNLGIGEMKVKQEDLRFLFKHIGSKLSWYYLNKVKQIMEAYKSE